MTEYHDELEQLVERAENATASLLVSLLAIESGLTASAKDKRSIRRAIKLLKRSKNTAVVLNAVNSTIIPAVVGALKLLIGNAKQRMAFGSVDLQAVAEKAVNAAVDLLESKYSSGTVAMPEEENVAVASKVAAGLLVRDAIYSAQVDVAERASIATSKRWITRGDARVRLTHKHLDGQTKRLREPFTTQLGSVLYFPGDTRSAAPEDYINCRCLLEIR
ncbi:head morphogenesis [Gordonia phage GMA2]|uniref:Phage head morphogenesis domain-containing protein n=1 Tax=Gordonia phage GMA2 TaxID=1647283 RepID=A0A0K0N6J1_9CAUD|nr:head morphogenesis [Gordonia phage GMA2]AKJ72544.1 hypothetical protein GMA2_6 [Gordonia phage GMA2]